MQTEAFLEATGAGAPADARAHAAAVVAVAAGAAVPGVCAAPEKQRACGLERKRLMALAASVFEQLDVERPPRPPCCKTQARNP